MATPMTPAQSKAAFLAEGLKVVEIPGYQTNDRAPATGRPAGPKRGNVNHHTGGDTSDPYKYAATVLFKGRSDLPGPLSHEGLDPDAGTLYMVGTGRTNHAGGGDPVVLVAVIADAVPYDRELRPTKGNSDGIDGNGPFYGLEVMYSGTRDLPRVGYVAMVKWNAARCRFHGWTGASCIGHREWSDDKPDPGHVNLPQLRRDVDAALALPAGVWPGTATPPPPPPPPKEDDMPAPYFLVRKKDSADGAVWLSNLVSRRWVVSYDDLLSVFHWFDQWKVDKTVYAVDDLRFYGVPSGDLPPSGANGDGPATGAAFAPAVLDDKAIARAVAATSEAAPDCADADDPHNA